MERTGKLERVLEEVGLSDKDELASSLQQIGLEEKEAQVYLALLSLGSATAYRIAEKCEVKKPTVYVILEDLRRKGLVLKVPHAKKALFSAVDIAEYLHDQGSKLSAVHRLMPKFNALSAAKGANVYFFSGFRGIEQAIQYKYDSMIGKTFYGFYGSLVDAADIEEIVRIYKKWDTSAVSAGITFKIVMPKKDARKYYGYMIDIAKTNNNVQIRLLDQYEYPPNASIGIGTDFLWILDEKNLQATVIDNASTADAMRQIFEIVWEKGV